MEIQQNKSDFLEQAADFILSKEGNVMKDAVVVFPNKRPALFLRKYLREGQLQNLWLPDILSIDEFISKVSGLDYEDPLRMRFFLYDIHKKIAGKDARTADEFLNWAPVMLRDFEDIDFSLAPAGELFSYLTDARALEQWNSDGTPLTPMQESYLEFFRAQKDYYEMFRSLLFERKAGYRGMVYRHLAENSDNCLPRFVWKSYYFVGFNALTPAERNILDFIRKKFDFEFLIDGDAFFMENRNGRQKEAGRFLSALLKKWNLNNPRWVGNRLKTDAKIFETAAVPLSVGQARYAGQTINRLLKEGVNPMDIAVVPADESLLVPLLASLPANHPSTGEKLKYNVTLGYSLKHSPWYFFVTRWLELLQRRTEEGNGRIFVPDLLALLNSTVMRFTAGAAAVKLTEKIMANNIIMIDADGLAGHFAAFDISRFVEILISLPGTPDRFTGALTELINLTDEKLKENNQDGTLLWEHQNELLRQQLVFIGEIIPEYGNELSWRILQKLFFGIFESASVSLRGEPLNGIQIMGVLETRSLDFKCLIIPGMNEGILPANSFNDTLIPFDIRKKFGLSMPQDSASVYAYHFFRLLCRAEQALFIYNSEPGNLGGGEKSRFLLQIEDELLPANKNIVYKETVVNSPLSPVSERVTIEIPKTADILESIDKLARRGFSASAFNTWINCPLQFYFRHILKIKEESGLETTVEANTFGSVVHGTLRDLYSPFVSQLIETKQLGRSLENIDSILKKNFEKEYKTSDLSYGRNLLIYNVAKEYVNRFVRKDIKDLEKSPRRIISLEKRYESTLEVNGTSVVIKGFFDRVDSRPDGSDIRIIDYKTGTVKPSELMVDDLEMLISSEKKAKAFQVFLYMWLYRKNFPRAQDVHPGIISLRNLSNGFMEAGFKKEITPENIPEKAEEAMVRLIEAIKDPAIPIVQRPDEKGCTFCAFKTICNRKGESFT